MDPMTTRTLTHSTETPRSTAIDDDRWQAVLARDEAADGRFVYGVTTTGIYCRPTCPSRRPSREHVQAFADPAGARAAGLRPCRRCDPDGAGPAAARATLVARATALLDDAGRSIPLDDLARDVGASPSHLHRTFRSVLGVTPKAYGDALRAERARDALVTSTRVTDAVYDAGYESAGRFHADAPGRLGMTPSSYRDGGAGERVRVAVAPSSLGAVLVAATDVGVCSIQLGDDPGELLAGLRERLPRAELVHDDPDFTAVVASVVELVEHPGTGDPELPLDTRGTAFQERVWRALRSVPSGTTTTYAELAAVIGAPGSARAVAGACAANPVAIAVPCHRVIRSDGKLSGYRWGVDRKAELLRRESAP